VKVSATHKVLLFLALPSHSSWSVAYVTYIFVFKQSLLSYSRGSQTRVHIPLVVHSPIARGTFRVSNKREKYFLHYSIQIFYTYEIVRTVSGSIESILVFCIFRWFISWTYQRQSWVLYWWSPVEPLDVCWLFCPSVRELQSILDVCQASTKSHGIIFNCSNTVCMAFKAKTVKSTVIPLLTLVYKE